MNLVAADVSPLHLPLGKVRADSRRLLLFRGSRREVFRGILSLNQPTPAPPRRGAKQRTRDGKRFHGAQAFVFHGV